MMPNVRVSGGSQPALNRTHIAKVSTQVKSLLLVIGCSKKLIQILPLLKQDGSCVQETFDSTETGPLANVLACEGKPGKVYLVIKLICSPPAHEAYWSCKPSVQLFL